MESKIVLSVNEVTKYFGGLKAVNNVTVTVRQGSNVGIIGPNGAGKTTLFNIIHGLLKQDSGTILYKENRIDGEPCHVRARNGMGRLFQDMRIFRDMTVLDNMYLGYIDPYYESLRASIFSRRRIKKIEHHQYDTASHHLQLVDLYSLRNKPAHDLSVGQQKLLAIARLLMSNSDLILLDEPVAGVNPKMVNRITTVIKDLENIGKTVVIIEHDLNWIFDLCNEIILMDQGQIAFQGSPVDLRSADLLQKVFIHGTARDGT